MQLVYYISPRKMTDGFLETPPAQLRVLNEALRPHLEHEEDRDGDMVHADLEEAKRLALDIMDGLGDKGIDILAMSVEDDLFGTLMVGGDIRDASRTDPFGGRLLKLSQHACCLINRQATIVPLRHMRAVNHHPGSDAVN